MPIFEVKVPQLSESVAEATLLQWKKKAGDSIYSNNLLATSITRNIRCEPWRAEGEGE